MTSAGWPSWSPSGARLLYLRRHERGSETAIMKPNGEGDRIVATDGALGWSPTGTQLVWNVDGEGRDTAWSPDGKYVAVAEAASGCFGAKQISIYDAATGARVHTPAPLDADCAGGGTWPEWSPDGRRIAYSNNDIYTVDITGNGRRRLTSTLGQDADPTWAPNGRWIAYLHPSGHYKDLYLMRPDGSRKHRIARRVMEAAWQRLLKR